MLPVPFFPVNSKAEIRFHLATADWIAEPVRQKMAVMVTPAPSFFLYAAAASQPLLGRTLVLPLFLAV